MVDNPDLEDWADGPYYMYHPSCCAIGHLADWPEFGDIPPKEHVRLLLESARDQGNRRVFVTLNHTQKRYHKPLLDHFEFKQIDRFMGNEGQWVYIFVKKFR